MIRSNGQTISRRSLIAAGAGVAAAALAPRAQAQSLDTVKMFTKDAAEVGYKL